MDGALNLAAGPASLSLTDLSINLALAAVLSFIISWHFVRFGSTFSNRAKFASVLPAIALTTVLVISVVKASLALSLGLVGALSIVRFRTPVKEPEELSYLFIAIALGLGLGADHRATTAVAIGIILVVLTVRSWMSRGPQYPNLYLDVELSGSSDDPVQLQDLLDLLLRRVPDVEMRRVDCHGDDIHATFYLQCTDAEVLTALQQDMRAEYPHARLTFVEQSGAPGG